MCALFYMINKRKSKTVVKPPHLALLLKKNVFWAGLHRQVCRYILHRVHMYDIYYIIVRYALMRDMSKIDVEGKKDLYVRSLDATLAVQN